MNKFILSVILFLFSCFACAEGSSEITIDSIRQYLKSLHHVSADFTQTDKYGNIQEGRFYLSRPGKMRWEYQDPKEITIIMDGTNVFYYDKKLDQGSQYVGKKGLISLFSEEDIFLSKDIKVIEFKNNGGSVDVVFANKQEGPGKITLIFDADPLSIIGFVIEEDSGSQISVGFNDLKNHLLLDEKLFRPSYSLAPKRQRNN